jgi:hypothetical protein
MMNVDDENAPVFVWIVPEGAEDIGHLSVDGDYVGSIAKNIENPSARHEWSWRVIIPDGVDRNTQLAGHADGELTAKKAAEEAYSRARRERG